LIALGEKFAKEANSSSGELSDHKATSIWAAVNSIENFSDTDRLANFFTFVIGGHDTTAHGMAFTLRLLFDHPEFLKRARAEVDAVVPENTRIPDASLISEFHFLLNCFKEAIRMYPPAGGTGRVIEETKTINGITIQAGTPCFVAGIQLNYNPRYWKDPHVFNPDRWSKEEEKLRPKCSFFTFSQGPRDCIGKTMAQQEAVVVIATLLKNFDFELAKTNKLNIDFGVTNKPLGGIHFRLKQRQSL
jgi:cholesterol 24(S)-hydroxylase